MNTCGERRFLISNGLQGSIVHAEDTMASTYALPASAMTHSHSHGHIHSHSHSPSRPYTSRTLKPERSNGSLDSHSQSDLHLDHSHSHARSHSHSHSREQEALSAPYLPTPPDSTGLLPIEKFEKQLYERSPALSTVSSYEPPLNDINVVPHDHSHHLHPHTTHVEPRSRFTNLILPLVLRWPLLHTIMAEKDSRRIFYFMRSESHHPKSTEDTDPHIVLISHLWLFRPVMAS